MKIEEAQEFVARELRERLQSFIGLPHDPEKIREAVLEQLHHVYRSLGVGPSDKETQALSELLAVGFLGMPENFNPKSLLENISDHTLDRLAACFGGNVAFPASLLTVEWMLRKGNIAGWDFTRVDGQTCNVAVIPKCALAVTKLELTFDPEDNN